MVNTLCESRESAIRRGIKSVGIGKRGSQPLSKDLAREILGELKEGKVTAAARGAFFAALSLKGVTAEELVLEEVFPSGTLKDPVRLALALTEDAPQFVQGFCSQILAGQSLDVPSAHRLGKFLFKEGPGDGARGLIASALRVRYETADEYEGLLKAIHETLESPFLQDIPSGDPIVQLSEPFDGVDQSYLTTPLLARHIQGLGYRVVHMVGRNSGPKFGQNLLDLAQALNVSLANSNQELSGPKPKWGWYVHQRDVSRAVDRWVEIRRQTVKRPFLSTLEKFINPTNARIIITSAFHPPYTEKMITIAERSGFPGAVVVRNGLEGTLAFPLMRTAKIMCSAKQKDGTYLRHEFEIDPERYLNNKVTTEEKLNEPSILENARLIGNYTDNGKTDYGLFDNRIKISCLGLSQALQWIEEQLKGNL